MPRVNESLAAADARAARRAVRARCRKALRRARRRALPGRGHARQRSRDDLPHWKQLRAPRAHPQRLAQAAVARTGSARRSPSPPLRTRLRDLIEELRAIAGGARGAARAAARAAAQLLAADAAAHRRALAPAGARGGGAARRVRGSAPRVDYTYVTGARAPGAHRGGRADRSRAAHRARSAAHPGR